MKYNKCNRLAASTWASGRITSFMEKGSSFLKMAHIMREPFTKANLKEKEDIFSIMDAFMKGESEIMMPTAMAPTMIRIRAIIMRVNGHLMYLQAAARKSSQMAPITKETSKKASKKE